MNWKIETAFVAGMMMVVGGCGKTGVPVSQSAQQATVALKDGSTFAGAVTASSPASITLQAASGESRTYPMSQVDTVQYGQPAPATSTVLPAPAANPASGNMAPLASSPAPASSPASSPASPSASPSASSPAPAPGSSSMPAPMPVPNDIPAAAPAPEVTFKVVPSGTSISVRTNETIDSKVASTNQTFGGVVSNDVRDTQGAVAIPRGSSATLIVRSVEGQGKMQGQSELALDMESVRVGGHVYRLETADIVERGKQGVGTNGRTAKFIGGGAALGTIIGAIAGGGKGAGIGALSGAGAGTLTQAVTRGKGVQVPAETMLTFRLESRVRIREVR